MSAVRPVPDAPSADPLDPLVVRQTAEWLVHLHSGEATSADWQACARWRAAHPEHERAWQRAQRVGGPLSRLPPEDGAAVLRTAAREAVAARSARRKTIRTFALLATVGPAGWLVYRGRSWQPWMAAERTATGELRTLVLADGSRVTLDTASAIDIAFDGDWRRIDFRAGAILVQTAADTAGRPFVVHTEAGRLRALGTRFTVGERDGRIVVQVIDGAVELRPARPAGEPLVIEAGEQAWMAPSATGGRAPRAAHAEAWAAGTLYAERMPLGDFLAEVGRYRPGVLRCDPDVAGMPVSGAFQLRDTDAVLAMLAESLPLRVEARSRYWVVVRGR